ncbi:hypothetical protein M3Y96_00508800 [Aphelenchoides besseyi]|nr:hypothetical protein M3Y96_00508800 [Aphelenchoides besseyi]
MPTTEQIAELTEMFPTLTINGSGQISAGELQSALKVCGVDIPGYQLRERLQKYGDPKALNYNQFSELADELAEQKNAETNQWKKRIGSVTGVYQVQSAAEVGVDEIVHTIRVEEELAFSNWINSNLSEDPDLKRHLPVNTGGDLYTKIQDGTSAFGVGIVVADYSSGCLFLTLRILDFQIGLFREIDLVHVPGLFRLLREGETLDDLRRLTPEQILIRWVNYHMDRAGVGRHLSNFTSDVTDSEIYTHLIHQIAPSAAGVSLSPLNVQGNVNRANSMLNEANKIQCREFVTANDVATGNYKLNLAFVANMFNRYPALPDPDADEIITTDMEGIEETREEKTYRNWMNSLGVDPYVHFLYSDLQNGLVMFELFEFIRPGIVNWKRVVKVFRKLQGMMDQIQNCNYAIELGKQLNFSLVGIQGKDIYDGNQTLTLALVWQLMRAYTLTVLAQCAQSGDRLATDREIINWVNEKLKSSGKDSRIKSFQDSAISNAWPVLHLIDAIKPGTINYELVQSNGGPEANLENAKYAITSGRKIGAKIYALPEDIVEVQPKMVLTVFATLMALDYRPNMHEHHSNGTSNGNH